MTMGAALARYSLYASGSFTSTSTMTKAGIAGPEGGEVSVLCPSFAGFAGLGLLALRLGDRLCCLSLALGGAPSAFAFRRGAGLVRGDPQVHQFAHEGGGQRPLRREADGPLRMGEALQLLGRHGRDEAVEGAVRLGGPIVEQRAVLVESGNPVAEPLLRVGGRRPDLGPEPAQGRTGRLGHAGQVSLHLVQGACGHGGPATWPGGLEPFAPGGRGFSGPGADSPLKRMAPGGSWAAVVPYNLPPHPFSEGSREPEGCGGAPRQVVRWRPSSASGAPPRDGTRPTPGWTRPSSSS